MTLELLAHTPEVGMYKYRLSLVASLLAPALLLVISGCTKPCGPLQATDNGAQVYCPPGFSTAVTETSFKFGGDPGCNNTSKLCNKCICTTAFSGGTCPNPNAAENCPGCTANPWQGVIVYQGGGITVPGLSICPIP